MSQQHNTPPDFDAMGRDALAEWYKAARGEDMRETDPQITAADLRILCTGAANDGWEERDGFDEWWPSVGQTIGKVAAWEAWKARAAWGRAKEKGAALVP